MTDLECFKLAGKLLIACFIGNILGTLLGNWRNRRVMRKYMPDKPSKDTLDPTQVQWPARSVAHEIYTQAPREWAAPPWVEFAEEMPIEEVRRRFPKHHCTCNWGIASGAQPTMGTNHEWKVSQTCPLHGDKLCQPSN